MEGLAARTCAHAILTRVYRDHAWAERLLARDLDELSDNDRAFVTHLVYGTLRQTLYLDFVLAHWLKRPPHKLPIAALVALRLGAFQLIEGRTPPHAACDTTVALVGLRHRHLMSVSNAVMRRIAEAQAGKALPSPEAEMADPHAALAVSAAHPEWLIRRVAALLGADETQAWARANNAPATLCLRVHHLRSTRDALLARLRAAGVPAEATWLPGGIALPTGAPVTALPGFDDGSFVVQDLGAQAVGLLAEVTPGMRILDACAAPGGKSVHLADRLHDHGEVIAVDKHASKTRLIAANATRLGLHTIRVAAVDVTDAAALAATVGAPVDMALVDAPCSGSGTLQRHPELRLKDGANVAGLVALQHRLLDSAAAHVRPGGQLVYSACSILPEEGPLQVQAFLERTPEFSLAQPSDAALQPVLVPFASGHALQTWPHKHGCDGFFAAVMTRRA